MLSSFWHRCPCLVCLQHSNTPTRCYTGQESGDTHLSRRRGKNSDTALKAGLYWFLIVFSMSAHSAESVFILPGVHTDTAPQSNTKLYQQKETTLPFCFHSNCRLKTKKVGPADVNVTTLSHCLLNNGSTISLTLWPSEQMTVWRQQGPVAIWHETATKLNKQRRFAKTTQQECIIRQQLSARETAIQIGRRDTQRVTKCEDQCEGCHS